MRSTRECVIEGISTFFNVYGPDLKDGDNLSEIGKSLPMDPDDWLDLKYHIEDAFDVAPQINVGMLNQCRSVGEIVKYVTDTYR